MLSRGLEIPCFLLPVDYARFACTDHDIGDLVRITKFQDFVAVYLFEDLDSDCQHGQRQVQKPQRPENAETERHRCRAYSDLPPCGIPCGGR